MGMARSLGPHNTAGAARGGRHALAPLKELKSGEVTALDGGFPGRLHGGVPWAMPGKCVARKIRSDYSNG